MTGWLLIAATAALAVVVAIVWIDQSAANPKLDSATLCPQRGPSSVTVVLVDATDELSLAQTRDFQNQLERLRAEIPRYGMLEIFLVRPTKDGLLSPIVSLCNPGRGAEISELTGNPRRVEARWRDGFEAPVDGAFRTVVSASKAKQSPVLEAIQSVALTALQSADRLDLERKLVVVSDLMQHTDAISFYRSLPEPKALIESPAFQEVRTNLRGVEVELWMLRRTKDPVERQGALAALWERLIREQNGQVIRIYNVNG